MRCKPSTTKSGWSCEAGQWPMDEKPTFHQVGPELVNATPSEKSNAPVRGPRQPRSANFPMYRWPGVADCWMGASSINASTSATRIFRNRAPSRHTIAMVTPGWLCAPPPHSTRGAELPVAACAGTRTFAWSTPATSPGAPPA